MDPAAAAEAEARSRERAAEAEAEAEARGLAAASLAGWAEAVRCDRGDQGDEEDEGEDQGEEGAAVGATVEAVNEHGSAGDEATVAGVAVVLGTSASEAEHLPAPTPRGWSEAEHAAAAARRDAAKAFGREAWSFTGGAEVVLSEAEAVRAVLGALLGHPGPLFDWQGPAAGAGAAAGWSLRPSTQLSARLPHLPAPALRASLRPHAAYATDLNFLRHLPRFAATASPSASTFPPSAFPPYASPALDPVGATVRAWLWWRSGCVAASRRSDCGGGIRLMRAASWTCGTDVPPGATKFTS